MTHTTRDFEHTLDLDNVVAVDYDEDGDIVNVFVTEKKPESELADDQIVANNLEKDSDVQVAGDVSPLADEIPHPQAGSKIRHRPIPGGVSEGNANITAGTCGMYPVEVVDTSKGVWDDSISEGDIVRLSNNHVYARINKAKFNEPIYQPGPYDGGTPDDEVGRLAGYVPIEEGCTVDVAARTVDPDNELETYHELDGYPSDVRREDFKSLKGETLTKTGRTTGVTEADVRATSASVRVNYGGDHGLITLRDQIITGDMSLGGDSGSPSFHKPTKELVGEMYAGSSEVTIHYKVPNIEDDFGVRLHPEDDKGNGGSGSGDGSGNGSGDDTNNKYMTSLKTTVSIDMEEPDLDLSNLSGDKPSAGETVKATAEFEGNYGGTAWVTVQDTRYEFEMSKDGSDEQFTGSAEVDIKAPNEYHKDFEVDIEGGYVGE